MTLIMYQLAPEEVIIVMDTLAADTAGNPVFFVTKCRTFPHLGMVVACTGLEEPGSRWASALQTRVFARDIVMLNRFAPEVLSEIWDDLCSEYAVGDTTSTVYQFGLPEGGREYVGYAYRSKNGFASEQLVHGIGIKPMPLDSSELFAPESPDEWIALAESVRSAQGLVDEPPRIRIGGALTLTALSGGKILSFELHRFDDYDQLWNQMNLDSET